MGDENGGRYVTIRWLVGILVSVLIMGATATVAEIRGDIAELKHKSEQAAVWRAEAQMDRVRLERIETKVDRLLEHRP